MKQMKKDGLRPPDDALWYLSLGGAGEIGMNLSLYGTAGKWLMVDCGVTFGDETTPGVDIIMPDIAFIADRRDDLLGLVITHGHEDHIGAIEHLWPYFQCPVYATKFTAELIRNKLGYSNLKGRVKIIEILPGGKFTIGPFQAQMVPVTHSIPESQMLTLQTVAGKILHTGDWKFDPEPLVGPVTDTETLQNLGREGLLAAIGDSTNALVPGHSGSERLVWDELHNLFKGIPNRIVVTCFASNIARLKSIAAAARKNKRYVTLVGRSLWRNGEVAEDCGYLPEFADFLSEEEAMQSPRESIVMICTGCQGEPRSALWRIATDDHPVVDLDDGDTVIFSSRDIPGNEKQIGRLQNRLVAKGLKIITQDDVPVHVSGHPAQDELAQLYQWTRPQIVLPVHGEPRHQMEHERIAKECQVPQTLIPANGQIIRLGPGNAEVIAEVPSGRLALDGKVIRKLDHEAAKSRRKMGFNGAIVTTLVLDARGDIVQDPQVTLMGLADENTEQSLRDDLIDAIIDAVEAMPKSTRVDDNAVRHSMGVAVRRMMQDSYGKKPVTEMHLVRV